MLWGVDQLDPSPRPVRQRLATQSPGLFLSPERESGPPALKLVSGHAPVGSRTSSSATSGIESLLLRACPMAPEGPAAACTLGLRCAHLTAAQGPGGHQVLHCLAVPHTPMPWSE